MSKRSDAIAEWDRCAWCWRPLTAEPYKKRGLPFCDERCAGNDASVAEEDAEQIPVSDAQLAFGDDA